MRTFAMFLLVSILLCFPLHSFLGAQIAHGHMSMPCGDCTEQAEASLIGHYQSMTDSVALSLVFFVLALVLIARIEVPLLLVRFSHLYGRIENWRSRPLFYEWLARLTMSPPWYI